MNKEEVNAIIEKLADKIEKPISCPDGKVGCLVYHYKITYSPVRIGDVLEKCEELRKDEAIVDTLLRREALLNYWSKCGFDKSFQQIVEKSGWKKRRDYVNEDIINNPLCFEEVLKDPNARALFEFLATIVL